MSANAPRVMIVEDEAEIAETLSYALKADGFEVAWENLGSGALDQLASERVDFVVLDVGLPDWNGFELLKEIRKTHSVPVLMLTARRDEVDRIVGLEIGADDYVTKPFSPREVVARIKVILRRAGGGAEISSHGFDIDNLAMRISYQGVRLELTRSEYALLSALVQRPGQIFSRRQLIEHIWSSNHPSDDRVVDTHVKSLRAKIKRIDPEADPIKTHRGFGYALEA